MATKKNLPHSVSPTLRLSHPTACESRSISLRTASSWKDALTVEAYLSESGFLSSAPLARDGGLATWILADGSQRPDEREVLASCETYRKRGLVGGEGGGAKDVVVYGIASVFCPAELRSRGYAARLMKEIREMVSQRRIDGDEVVGSVLFSDIGREYYARLGWKPHPRNIHLEFTPNKMPWPATACELREEHLAELCRQDEAMIRNRLARRNESGRNLLILPDLDHMLWHIRKEDFATQYLFGKKAPAKGAVAGEGGRRVWLTWTRRYYSHPAGQEGDNVLHVLRTCIEDVGRDEEPSGDSELADRQLVAAMQAVLQAAVSEAHEWQLSRVEMWDPSPKAKRLIENSGLGSLEVVRNTSGVASALWLDESIEWTGNEYYAWC